MLPDFYELAENAFFYATMDTSGDGSWEIPETEAAEALRGLQPSVRYLREEYRRPTPNPVYEGPNTFAYLLAYVPIYIRQSMKVLEIAGLHGEGRDKKRVGLFCCGPCPEAVALTEMLRGPGGRKQPDRFCLELFDNHHEGWAVARDALLDVSFLDSPGICRDRGRQWRGGWKTALSEQPGIHDFNVVDGLSPANKQIVAQLDVAMFQNFDNELGPDVGPTQVSVDQTIEEIARLLPPGSKLILSGLAGAMNRHRRLLAPLRKYGEVWRDWKPVSMPSPTPGGLTDRFLLDGSDDCIPRVRLFLNYLVFERAPVPSP
tara:strand:+ start:186 stop:1136 length:951 start_codon:yes stop_codon:yes gene_type:complete